MYLSYMADKFAGLPIWIVIALALGGGFIFLKSKSNGGGGMSNGSMSTGAYIARKPGGCGCGK